MSADTETLGQCAADFTAKLVGSWPFIIWQSAALVAWIALNTGTLTGHWDEYPFVFLNLMLSFQAAYTGPIVMISQNRQEQVQRRLVEDIYRIGQATLAMAEAQRDMLSTHSTLLRMIREQDERILKTLTELKEE
ncbi:MAG: DUF1003 domain-containing protein [Nitrobacter sp.]